MEEEKRRLRMPVVAAVVWGVTRQIAGGLGYFIKDSARNNRVGMLAFELLWGSIAYWTYRARFEGMNLDEAATILTLGCALSIFGGTIAEGGARAVLWYVNLEKRWQKGEDVFKRWR